MHLLYLYIKNVIEYQFVYELDKKSLLFKTGMVVVRAQATLILDHEYDEGFNDLDSKVYQDFSQDITSRVSNQSQRQNV